MYVRRLYMRAKSNRVFGDGSTRGVCAFWPAWTSKLPLCRRIEWNCEREREVKEEKKRLYHTTSLRTQLLLALRLLPSCQFCTLSLHGTHTEARTHTNSGWAHVFVRRVHPMGTCSITQPCVPAHVTPNSLGTQGRIENSVRCDRKGEQCALATAATVWVLVWMKREIWG